MTYKPKNNIMWDLWFLEDKDDYHCFYLQSRPSNDPLTKHLQYVSIGHAVSKDLKEWTELGTVLKPGKKGEWDDYAIRTGSVIKKGKRFYMYYTGRNHKEKNVQRIGLAISNDLINWRKHEGNPILEADKRSMESM